MNPRLYSCLLLFLLVVQPSFAKKPASIIRVRNEEFRGGHHHLGLASRTASLHLPLKRRWTFSSLNVGIHSASKSSPVSDGTSIYVGADNERFYAIDAKTGMLRWTWYSRPCRNGIHGTAAIKDGSLYIGDYAGYCTALDTKTGKVLWERHLGDSIGASPCLSKGLLWLGIESRAPNGWLVALNQSDGSVHRRYANLGDHTHCTPTLDLIGRRVFLGSNMGRMHCFDMDSSKELWNFQCKHSLERLPARGKARPHFRGQIKSTAAFHGNRIWFTSWDWHCYCLNATTGEMIWSFATKKRSMSSPTIDPKHDRVYFGSHDKHVYALRASSGELLWKYRVGKKVYSSPVIVNQHDSKRSLLVVGSSDKRIYALDAGSGKCLWSEHVGSGITSVPLLMKEQLYVATNIATLICWN